MPTHIGSIEHIENAHFYGEHFQNLSSSKVNISKNIQDFFDSLNERYQNRYEQKLDGFFEISLEVKKDWSTQTSQIIKDKYNKNANSGEAIKVVAEAFQEHGRLLIIGNPGAGKTVLLLKLAISLLEKCDFKDKDWSFPVIFNLASWSEYYKNFEDWLIATLVKGNGLSKDFAAFLLENKRIIFLLDGLDELARNEDRLESNKKRANCLNSLNLYLTGSNQAVICCRREEFRRMQIMTGQDTPVTAIVEVLNLEPEDVKTALTKAVNDKNSKAAANNILRIIDTNNEFLSVITTPFYFTTALEVFDIQNVDISNFSTKDFKDKNFIEHFLITKFLEKRLYDVKDLFKENPVSGNYFYKIYDCNREWQWLKNLAKIMERKQLITFELSDLQPSDLKFFYGSWKGNYKFIFTLVSSILGGFLIVLFGLFFSLFSTYFSSIFSNTSTLVTISEWFATGRFRFWLIIGLFLGFIVGLFTSSLIKDIQTNDKYKLNLSALFRRETWSKTNKVNTYDSYDSNESGGIGCMIAGCSFWSLPLASVLLIILNFLGLKSNIPKYIIWGALGNLILIGIFYFFSVIVIPTLSNVIFNCRISQPFSEIKTPYKRFYAGISKVIRNILVTFIIGCTLINLMVFYKTLYFKYITILLLFSSIFLILFFIFSTPMYKHFVLRICFYLYNYVHLKNLLYSLRNYDGKLPLRLVSFLDSATKAGILEKDGGLWRFRHQNIQQYFTTEITKNKNEGNWETSSTVDFKY